MNKNFFKLILFFILGLVVCLFLYLKSSWPPLKSLEEQYGKSIYDTIITKKESTMIDSLQRLKFYNIRISKPIIGLAGPYGSNVYGITMSVSEKITNDSLNVFFKNLSKTFFCNIITDSFIYDMEFIYINNLYCPSKNTSNQTIKCEEKEFRFYKDSLEKWCGFQVEKTSNNQFIRVTYQIR